ncbi:proline-tRNA ligase [Batrachochytrium salamandrivorans]|nr:proline-tRNA ligase [Batrachochytrium salamandrivorans]
MSNLDAVTTALQATLILKPSKGSPASVILAVALDSTEFTIGALAKSLGHKDARVATDDLVKTALSVDKIDATPFAMVNVEDKTSVIVVVDKNIMTASGHLVCRAFGDNASLFFEVAGFTAFMDANAGVYAIHDFSAPAAAAAPSAKSKKEVVKKDQADGEKEVVIGLTYKKEEDFSNWYSGFARTEMMEYYDISGCYIIRPWAYTIWKHIQKFLVLKLRKLVGQSDLAEPIAVRPTSETVMYPYYSTWIRSHRDLPLHTISPLQYYVLLKFGTTFEYWIGNDMSFLEPFLRTQEFLWQEGHTAFATKEESDAEVRQILDLYRQVYEDLLAVPVVPGRKSEKEKFAGGLYTTTVEGFIPSTGRAIQGATSHCLGQNFSKMFKILMENESRERVHVWQNSWGLTTRTIGVMVMVHVIVIPVGITAKTSDADRANIYAKAEELAATLKKSGVRAKSDSRDNYSPGYKYNHWELRGVQSVLSWVPRIFPRMNLVVFVATMALLSSFLDTITTSIPALLAKVQASMFEKAKKERDSRVIQLESWDKFVETLNKKCLVLAPWCEEVVCEESVKDRSACSATDDNEPVDDKAPSMGAKSLCIPFEQPEGGVKSGAKCFACERDAVSYTLWGRSY